MISHEVCPKKYLSSFVLVLGKILYPNIFWLYPVGYLQFCHTVPQVFRVQYVGLDIYFAQSKPFLLTNREGIAAEYEYWIQTKAYQGTINAFFICILVNHQYIYYILYQRYAYYKQRVMLDISSIKSLYFAASGTFLWHQLQFNGSKRHGNICSSHERTG